MPDNNITNLDELTAKIYHDGMQKAEERSKEIVDEAESRMKEILAAAEGQAQQIIAEANREAERTRKSVENELRLKSRQLISDLKREIRTLVSHKMISDNLSKSFMDTAFLQKMVIEAIGYWKTSGEVTITLPEKLREKLDKQFEKGIGQVVDGLTIHFSGQLSGGFRIKRNEEDFEITFSEEDFNTLFQSYLSDNANTLIFKG